jgi:hypothetical protein
MSKKRIVYLSLLILLILILTLTKPSSDSFNNWLSNKYNLECQENECIRDSYNWKVVNRDLDNYFIFNKIGIKLKKEDGVFLLIEGIGVFGVFSTYTYKVFEE